MIGVQSRHWFQILRVTDTAFVVQFKHRKKKCAFVFPVSPSDTPIWYFKTMDNLKRKLANKDGSAAKNEKRYNVESEIQMKHTMSHGRNSWFGDVDTDVISKTLDVQLEEFKKANLLM